MKSAVLLALAVASSASVLAGLPNGVGINLPDAGASVLLLGIGVGALGMVRRMFKR